MSPERYQTRAFTCDAVTRDQLVGRHAVLRERVALAQRDGAVLDRLVVDRDGERRADLVLAPVALADVPAGVVLGAHVPAQLLVDLARALGVAVLAQQRQHRDLDRRHRRVQPQHGALLAADLVLVVGVAQQREHRAADAGGRLDHVRDVALARLGVEVLELLAGELAVLGEVEVAAVGDALQLRPADRVQVLDVGGRGRVVRELVGVVVAQAQALAVDAEPRRTSPAAPAASSRTTGPAWSGGTKNSISICSNSSVRKMKLPGVISLRNDLPTCAMPNGGLRRAYWSVVLKSRKMPCAVSGRR